MLSRLNARSQISPKRKEAFFGLLGGIDVDGNGRSGDRQVQAESKGLAPGLLQVSFSKALPRNSILSATLRWFA